MVEPFLERLPWPADTVITQRFGANGHRGLDGGCPTGTRLVPGAPAVVCAGTNDGSYGDALFLDYENGLYGVLAHNSRVLVAVGERVTARQTVALSGWSGYVEPPGPAGAHSHFQLCVNTRFSRDIGESVDPLNYLIPEADMALANQLLEAIFGDEAGLAAWLARQRDPNIQISPLAQAFLLSQAPGQTLDRRLTQIEERVGL